jgi:hypothetical protein
MDRDTIQVLNPTGEALRAKVKVPALPANLEGRTVGFLDNTKPNFAQLATDLGELLSTRYGVRTIVHRRKANASTPAPPGMLSELARECDLVFTGSAD